MPVFPGADQKPGPTKTAIFCRRVDPHPVLELQGEEPVLKLSDALTAYRTFARAEGLSPRTVDWVSGAAGYFRDFLGEADPDLAMITGHDLRRFIIALQDKNVFSNHPFNKQQNKKLSPESVSNYVRGVKNLYSFLHRESFLRNDPMAKVKLPKKPQTVVSTLSEKEAEKLLAQPDKATPGGYRDYVLMVTLVDTAMRLSELTGLDLASVDYDQNLLKIRGKGQKERYVPFGRKLAKLLMKYQTRYRVEPEGTDAFFLSYDGRRLQPKRVEKIIRTYGRKAGLKRVYPHLLRHTSAVMFLRAGGDVFSLQHKLGHSSLTMTRRYSNLSDTSTCATSTCSFHPGTGLIFNMDSKYHILASGTLRNIKMNPVSLNIDPADVFAVDAHGVCRQAQAIIACCGRLKGDDNITINSAYSRTDFNGSQSRNHSLHATVATRFIAQRISYPITVDLPGNWPRIFLGFMPILNHGAVKPVPYTINIISTSIFGIEFVPHRVFTASGTFNFFFHLRCHPFPAFSLLINIVALREITATCLSVPGTGGLGGVFMIISHE